jgi:hypothetical protein
VGQGRSRRRPSRRLGSAKGERPSLSQSPPSQPSSRRQSREFVDTAAAAAAAAGVFVVVSVASVIVIIVVAVFDVVVVVVDVVVVVAVIVVVVGVVVVDAVIIGMGIVTNVVAPAMFTDLPSFDDLLLSLCVGADVIHACVCRDRRGWWCFRPLLAQIPRYPGACVTGDHAGTRRFARRLRDRFYSLKCAQLDRLATRQGNQLFQAVALPANKKAKTKKTKTTTTKKEEERMKKPASFPFARGVVTVRLDRVDVVELGLEWLLGGAMVGATAALLIKYPPKHAGTLGEARAAYMKRVDVDGRYDASQTQCPHSDGATAAIVPVDDGYALAMYDELGNEPALWPIPLGSRGRLEANTPHGGAPKTISWVFRFESCYGLVRILYIFCFLSFGSQP